MSPCMLADFFGQLINTLVGRQFSEYWVVLSKVLPNTYPGEPPSKWLVMHALRSGTLVWRPPAPLTTAPKARSPTQCYNPQQNRNDWARVSKIHGFWGAVVMAKRKKATGKTNATMHRSKTG